MKSEHDHKSVKPMVDCSNWLPTPDKNEQYLDHSISGQHHEAIKIRLGHVSNPG